LAWRGFHGQALRRAGHLVEARRVLEAVVATCEPLQGEDHPDCLSNRVDALDLLRREEPVAPDAVADLCRRVDAVTVPDALLRSRCSALWLEVLQASGAAAGEVATLRRERLGWLDAGQLGRYA